MKASYPVALPAPDTSVTYLNTLQIQEAIETSRISPRKRIIAPLHKTNDDKLHRMFNVLQPGTYIRPHCHISDSKSEAIVILKGRICFITFKKDGEILSYQNMGANEEIFGVDLEPDTIHTFIVLESDTVIFEVKPGPYIKANDKDFMEWSPEEGTEEAERFVKKMNELTQTK